MNKDIINYETALREKVANIGIYLRKNEKVFDTFWWPNGKKLTHKQMYDILKNIYNDLGPIPIEEHIKNIENMESFEALIGFRCIEANGKIRYTYLPEEMPKELLIKYLCIVLSIYEAKNGIFY